MLGHRVCTVTCTVLLYELTALSLKDEFVQESRNHGIFIWSVVQRLYPHAGYPAPRPTRILVETSSRILSLFLYDVWP